MQGNHLFEYAVIRVVPRVERQEFLNVGVIVYCSKENFLQTKYLINKRKIKSLFVHFDPHLLEKNLEAFQKICKGDKTAGYIATLPMVERFGWLTATRSTILQISKVHSGLCKNAEATLEKLFDQLVL